MMSTTTTTALEVASLKQYGDFVQFLLAAFRNKALDGLHIAVSNKHTAGKKIVTCQNGVFTVYRAGRKGALGEKVASFPVCKLSRLQKALNVFWVKPKAK